MAEMSSVMTQVDRRWRLYAVVLGLATLLALIDAGPTYLGHSTAGYPITWIRTLEITLTLWLSLGLLALPVLWLAGSLRIDQTDQPRRLRNGLLHTGAAVAFALTHLVLYVTSVLTFVRVPRGFWGVLSTHVMWLFTVDFLIYWAILGAYHAFHYYRVATERDVLALQLRANLMEARLQALRAQLNPHFLFNTLNAVSVLAMKRELPSVVRVLAQLSDLLRVSLDDGQPQEVPLARELEFIDRYLEIQRIRFSERLSVERYTGADALDVLVPSLILQPIVENAIVHGISSQIGEGRIAIRAVCDRGILQLSVRDTGPGFRTNGDAVRKGIGLTNTRERLRCLYGQGDWIECDNVADGGAIVTISIPVNRRIQDGERSV
jgi:signal transduction histidine kinase